MAANQGAANTSNSDSRFSSGPSAGWLVMYICTPAGSMPFCGSTDPGTLATASRNSSTRAVRIDVSCRHPHRSHRVSPAGSPGRPCEGWPG